MASLMALLVYICFACFEKNSPNSKQRRRLLKSSLRCFKQATRVTSRERKWPALLQTDACTQPPCDVLGSIDVHGRESFWAIKPRNSELCSPQTVQKATLHVSMCCKSESTAGLIQVCAREQVFVHEYNMGKGEAVEKLHRLASDL